MVPQPLQPNPNNINKSGGSVEAAVVKPKSSTPIVVQGDSDSELICLRFTFTEQIVKEIFFSTQQLQEQQEEESSGSQKVPSKSGLGWKEDRKAVRRIYLFVSLLFSLLPRKEWNGNPIS